ncbi:MAG: UDP-N-acetylmuramate dehydrogenase [Candidatus Nanosyncoccaceae bacterium]|jgi:UDP-N-acetylmuramate dehydrogenase
MNQPLKFQQNVALGELTTMKLGMSRAKYFYVLNDKQDLPKIHLFAVENGLKIRVLGGGSNSLATDEVFDGIIIKNELRGIVNFTTEDGKRRYVVASGETWDNFVARTVADGMTGVELTSGIPGSVGAAPIQNAGAYGQEVADTMVEFEAYDLIDNRFVTVKTSELEFAYRTSTLKRRNTNRYIITSVTFDLVPGELKRPFYWSLEKYVEENNLTDYSPAKIREYVLAIRAKRIPNCKEFPSAGSFFENAEIPPAKFEELKRDYPDLLYGDPQPNGLVKIPTGWLIEKAGLAGQTIHGINITAHNPMILVNESARTYQDLELAKQTIADAVKDKFAIDLEPEPIVIC